MTSHRRGLLGALALALSAGVVVALVLVAGSPSPTTAAGAAKAPAGAATVRQRNLVQTDTEAGTLSYANAQTVYDRLSGTITWLPRVGQVIRAGGTLFRVNGSPVLLMNGDTPAYRALSSADTDGPDVLELNRNLVALGFNANGIVVDDEWQEATSLGVELLQESLGETATGSLSLGRVVFLPGPQLVSTVDGTIGDTANGGSSTTPASAIVDPPAPEFVSLTTPATTTTTTTMSTAPTTTSTTSPTTTTTPPSPTHHRKDKQGTGQTPSLAALLALLKAESAQLKAEAEQLKAEQRQNGNPTGSGNANGSGKGATGSSGNKGSSGSSGTSGNRPSSGSGNAGSGGTGTGSTGSGSTGSGSTGEAVLATSSPHLVVTVDLNASLQSEAKVGEHVTVQLPAGNTVNGNVTAVSSVAQSSSSGGDNGGGNGGGGSGGGGGAGGSGSGSSSTIPVTVTLSGHHKGAGLDEAAVSVNFAQARANHVLSVPVTALLAVSGGNYSVQEAAAPHTLIPVNVGLFAAGYVQISGPGIHPGLQVTDSQG
jgi:hypothetical protein